MFHFDGDEVEIIPSDAGLTVALGRDGPERERARARRSVHAALRALLQPGRGDDPSVAALEQLFARVASTCRAPTNAATSAPAPESTGGDVKQAAAAVAAGAGSALTVVLMVGGFAVGAYVLSQLVKRRAAA